METHGSDDHDVAACTDHSVDCCPYLNDRMDDYLIGVGVMVLRHISIVHCHFRA